MVLGVDIGFSGGIAFIDGGNIFSFFPMPVIETEVGNELNIREIYRILQSVKIDHAFIERQNVRPFDGKVGAFKHGGQYYQWRALMTILQIPVSYPTPQSWKKAMMPDMDRSIKESSFARVRQLFPILDEFKKKEDGIVEAILIAKYGFDKITCK